MPEYDIMRAKLRVPTLVETYVPRTLLYDQIGTKPVTLITAPAGYGKTMTVVGWVRQQKMPVVWLSLDEDDRTAVGLVRYLVAGMRGFAPHHAQQLERYLNKTQVSSPQELATLLLNTWEGMPAFTLILDDYHRIDVNAPVYDLLPVLLDHIAGFVRLIISSRVEPALPLARLRVREQLIELNENHLRFSFDDIQYYVHQTALEHLTETQLRQLNQHLEGWPAGIQLATLLLHKQGVDHFPQLLHGNTREFSAYFFDEVFVSQPAEVQAFLVATSILESMNADLCDAMLGHQQSQDLLATLHQRRLFVTLTDEALPWYRYHQLFKDFLQVRLQNVDPSHRRQNHQRAAKWYRERGMIEASIHHLISCQDWETLRDVLLDYAQSYIGRGESARVKQWLLQLPDITATDDAPILLLMLRILFIERDIVGIEPYLQHLQTLDLPLSHYAEQTVWEGCMAYLRGEWNDAVASLEANLPLIAPDDKFLTVMAMDALGTSYAQLGRMRDAYQTFQQAVTTMRSVNDIFLGVVLFQDLFWIHLVQGQLEQAANAIQQVHTWAQHHQVTGSPWVRLLLSLAARVHMHRHQLAEAERLFYIGYEAAEQLDNANILLFSQCLLATYQHYVGQHEAAHTLLNQAEAFLIAKNLPELSGQPQLLRIQFFIAEANVSRVSLWLAMQATASQPNPVQQMLVARALMMLERFDDAWQVLTAMHTQNLSDYMARMELDIVTALVLDRLGKVGAANDSLSAALERGIDEGFVWMFVQHGDALGQILKRLKKRKLTHEMAAYTSQLLAVIERNTQLDAHALENPLTPREQEILHALGQGHTTPEIAEQLFISNGTVRNHVKSIYRKLDVNNRVQMLERARMLQLI